jgi:hypothetical protein
MWNQACRSTGLASMSPVGPRQTAPHRVLRDAPDASCSTALRTTRDREQIWVASHPPVVGLRFLV